MPTCPNCSTRYYEAKTTVCPTCQSDLSTVEDALRDRARIPTSETPQQGKGGKAGPSPARFEPGALLGERYRVIHGLGRGGMGEVYRAHDLELGGSVALKFLPATVERDERRLGMLLYETRIARTVSHPNVCRVHDIGTYDAGDRELHFISMEYIDGEDLASLLLRIGHLPKAKALELSLQLCAGLEAIHDRGLLHCDIKPGNVMIDSRGHARITDFGLAVVGSLSATYRGTPAYMAPEQHMGRETTVRSDVYALGLVLYEIFTGQRAFRAGSPAEYAWLHLQTRPVAPSELVPGLDPEVEKPILACLETLLERRTPTVAAVASQLAEINPNGPTLMGRRVEQGETLCTLLLCDLVGSTAMAESLGNRLAADLGRRHDRLARDLLARHQGREIDKTDGFLLLFERPIQALRFALDYHETLGRLSSEEGRKIEARVGIHFGEVWLRENPATDIARGAKPIEVEGVAKAVAARLMSVAAGGQILLSRGAFDFARRAADGLEEAEGLRWLDHGSWRLHGVADPVDIFEVGREGRAPLRPPQESEKVRRLLMQPRIEGWRPAPGLAIPGRPHWQVERRLGEGGFGEVWLAQHTKTAEQRSFKFCFDAERLRALQREITLFRLLKEELGDREDINRILDWDLDEAPFFIESEYTAAGNLAEWAEAEGGLAKIPLVDRLEMLAQVATALAAAHSVGILHKDVKPSNILIRSEVGGGVRAQLADFGIGQVTERERLAAAGITVLGLSDRAFEETSSAGPGTRLYMAPEMLEGQTPTLQADIYSLGVVLYQVAVGDLGRALAPGWRRDIGDELLADDIAYFMDRSPELRPASARDVADRLRTLDQRRRNRQAEIATRKALESLAQAQRRRKIYRVVTAISLLALLVVSSLAVWAVDAGRKEKRAHESTEQVLDFMVRLFEITNPFGAADPEENRGETVTAREILDRGTERIEDEFQDQPLVRARLMATFGSIYYSLGLYPTARPLLEKSLRIRRQGMAEDPEVAQSLYQLALLLDAIGDLDRALSVQREALELRERSLGAEHPDTLRSMVNLALSFYALGDFEQSRELREQTLEIQQRVLGPEHPDTSSTMDSLGSSFYALGDFEQARILKEQALEIQQRVLGPEHPHTVHTIGNLANVFDSLGDFEQARKLQEQTLELKRRTLGPEHPSTLATMANLASSLFSLGDFEQARKLQEQALEIQQRVLGPEHRLTVGTKASLALSFYYLGDFEQAKELNEQTLEIQQRTFGPEHPITLVIKVNLAADLCSCGDFEQARRLGEEALETQKRVLGPEHPYTLGTMSMLTHCYYSLGDLEQARLFGAETLETQKRVLGPEHLYTVQTMDSWSNSLRALGDLEQARALQEGALEIRTRTMPPDHLDTLDLMSNLAGTLREIGEFGRANELASEAFEKLEAKLGSEHFYTSRAARRLLEIAVDRDDPEAITSSIEKLRWLSKREETSLASVEQQRTRRYVIELMARFDAEDASTLPN